MLNKSYKNVSFSTETGEREALKRKLLRALGEKLFGGNYKKGKRRFVLLSEHSWFNIDI